MSAPAGAPLVEAVGIEKHYGSVHALKGVSFTAGAGEVVGLIGANGAGKSTLVKVISGQVQRDSGTLAVAGEPATVRSPREAMRLGIAVVPQELALIEDQSVAENIFLGGMPNRVGLVDRRTMAERARRGLAAVGLEDVDPRVAAGSLNPVQQRLVGIAEAICKVPRILIMDEPSAALPHDAAVLLGPIIARLAASGTAIVYVSHRLGEIHEFCDRVVAMRDGRIAGSLEGEEREISRMVELVGGRALAEEPEPETGVDLSRPCTVRARGLSARRVADVDLDLHEGEIVGVGGLYGSGRSELLRLLGGSQRPAAGELEILGGPAPRSPRAAMKRGVGYLPEGRRAMAFPGLSVAANTTIAALDEVSRFGNTLITRGRERSVAAKVGEEVNLIGDLDAPILSLSGGNQQKAFLGRWMLRRPRLLLLDEPTIGIDVHARAEIHRLIRGLADEGATIVVACAEPEELVLLCNRVIVLVEGRKSLEMVAPFEADRVVAASYAH